MSGRLLRLDVSREQALGRAAEIVLAAWTSFDNPRPDEPPLDEHLAELLRLGLPEEAAPALGVLDDAALVLDRSIAQPRPRYFAFVGSSGLEIGVIADLLAHCFDVNLATWAAAATRVEQQSVEWAAQFVGYPAESGAFTSGGTVSNVTALAAARERAIPGARRSGLAGHVCAVYCSADVHYSVRRAAEILGIGGDNVRGLAMDEHRRLRPEALAEAILADRRAGVVPIAVVATAGTTLTGAVDPLDAIADVCASHDTWMHVDGAYGLPAATAPSTRALFRGLDRADSVSLDGHKWLYLPKACGVVLVRRRESLEAALAHEEAYILHERAEPHMVDITLEYSRPFRALKLWLAFRAHGAEAFRQAVERNLAQARLLVDEIEARPDTEIVGTRPQLSIVPFRHVPAGVADLDAHNAALVRALQTDGRVWIAPAVVDGTVCLRPCIVNFRTTDADVRALVEIACEVGERIARRPEGDSASPVSSRMRPRR